jgi:ring-1,2-phenylacetyl-CoA epoxidase subunit PaaB
MSETKDNQGPIWEVFIQSRNNLPYKHVGSVHAFDGEMALQNARDTYTRRGEGRSIWVVPAEAIVASVPDEEASFFDPADDKIYRHPTFYTVQEGVKNM